MELEHRLALGMLENHPAEAARALEELPSPAVARLLQTPPLGRVAPVIAQMQPEAAAALLPVLPEDRAVRIVEALPFDAAALRLRRLDAALRDRILEALPARRARPLRSLLRFPEGTAGALMDPDVLALPTDLSVGEALERVRQAAHHARYNLYVVDRRHRLVGVVNLRELLIAAADDSLGAIMHSPVHRIAARADSRAILAHPGWHQVHALPVVDEDGGYLGAIRYRTLRRLQEELRRPSYEAGVTARALGDLFRTGASAMLETVAASPAGGSGAPGRSADES